MSESTAGKRIGAARTARRFRSLFTMVARGLAPQPDVPSSLRALPTRTTAAPAPAPAPAPALPALALPAPPALSAAPPMRVQRRSSDPAPLSPGRYGPQVTLGQNARDKLKQLQDLLAHQIPSGDPTAIVERALDALLTQGQGGPGHR